MNSEIYLIDNYSNNTKSAVHSSSYTAKALFFALSLILIILTRSQAKLALYALVILSLVALSKVPVEKVLLWSLYPLAFGIFFALSQLGTSYLAALTTLLKVLDTVLLAIFFATTAGFIMVLSKIPSKTLRSAFLLTYRFFFITLDSMSRRMKMLEIRGIKKASVKRKMKALSEVIGHQLIHTFEKAERIYSIMQVRGFSGKIALPKPSRLNAYDFIFLAASAAVVSIWLI